MKILFVIPYLGTIYGGTSKIVTELVQGLTNFDINIDVVTTNANGSDNLKVPLNTWIPKTGYRVKYFLSWHQNDLIFSPFLTSWLFNHVVDYNLVHTHTIFAPLISLTHWACKFNKIPYIMTPHGMLEPWALSYKAWKKKNYYALLEKSALQQASAIQGTASTEVDNIQNLGFERTIFVPNGINRQEYETLPEPEVFYQKFPATRNKTLILFLGRIDPKKGLDLLAPAFSKIHKKFPQTHLIVAGPDSIGFLPTAKNYFEQAGCLHAVTFTGMLTGSLKHAALAAASFYVAPSYSEGFSMSVLEGMVSGLPCIITKGCNFPEATVAKAAYVTNINADEIADALIFSLSNPEEAKAIGDRARQLILEQYTWDKIAAKMVNIYQAILNSKDRAYCL